MMSVSTNLCMKRTLSSCCLEAICDRHTSDISVLLKIRNTVRLLSKVVHSFHCSWPYDNKAEFFCVNGELHYVETSQQGYKILVAVV